MKSVFLSFVHYWPLGELGLPRGSARADLKTGNDSSQGLTECGLQENRYKIPGLKGKSRETHAGNEYYDGKSDKVSSYPFLKSIFAEYIDAIREEELYKERDYKDGHKLLGSSSKKKNRITYAT